MSFLDWLLGKSPSPPQASKPLPAPTLAPVGSKAPTPILAEPAAPIPSAYVPTGDGKWQPGTVPPLAAKMLASFESFRALPYDDNGAKSGGTWTIGYGSTRDFYGKAVTSNTPVITEAEALVLKQRDMLGAAEELADMVRVPITNNQAAALISFVYNFGGPALKGSTLLKLVNARVDSKELGAQFKQWRNQRNGQGVLVPELGLVRRRHAEWAVYSGQTWQSAYNYAWAKINKLSDWPPLNI